MSFNFNKIELAGNLTRDPELKFTPQGSAVCKLGIAVNRQYKGSDGEMQKEVQYFNITVWGKTGENCGKFLAKGRPVFVVGRLQNRSWEKDGVKHSATDIVADEVHFLGGRPTDQEERGGAPAGAPPADPMQGEMPF